MHKKKLVITDEGIPRFHNFQLYYETNEPRKILSLGYKEPPAYGTADFISNGVYTYNTNMSENAPTQRGTVLGFGNQDGMIELYLQNDSDHTGLYTRSFSGNTAQWGHWNYVLSQDNDGVISFYKKATVVNLEMFFKESRTQGQTGLIFTKNDDRRFYLAHDVGTNSLRVYVYPTGGPYVAMQVNLDGTTNFNYAVKAVNYEATGGGIKMTANGVNSIIQSGNASYLHFYTSAPYGFYFDSHVRVRGDVYAGTSYNRLLAYQDTVPTRTVAYANWDRIYQFPNKFVICIYWSNFNSSFYAWGNTYITQIPGTPKATPFNITEAFYFCTDEGTYTMGNMGHWIESDGGGGPTQTPKYFAVRPDASNGKISYCLVAMGYRA